MMKKLLLSFLLLLVATDLMAQQRLNLDVASFVLVETDMDAQAHQKLDADGRPMALIKVTSTNPDDNLQAYHFNFGYPKSEVGKYDGEVLWLYVQRNAQQVSITRDGYASVRNRDLGLTIEGGRVYAMQLRSEAPKIYTQMVMFTINPANSRATVTVKAQGDNSIEDVLGMVDETGAVAKNLPLGTYTYRVLAEGYKPVSGIIRLNDMSQTNNEQVKLEARFAMITLNADTDADIYVNGELKGNRSWTGRLNGGKYQVECRKTNHRPTTQTITVKENQDQTISLQAPSPITGTLSVMSKPLGADITIDNQPQGQTPKNIRDLLIGRHTIVAQKSGYESLTQSFDITDGQVTNLNLTLKKGTGNDVSDVIGQTPSNFASGQKELTINPDAVKYQRRAKTLRTIGWIGGGVLAAGGIVRFLTVGGNYDSQFLIGSICSASSLAFTTTFFSLAHSASKKANSLQGTTFKNSSSGTTLKIIGWGGGIVLVGLGTIAGFLAGGNDSYEKELAQGIAIGVCSIPWTATFLWLAQNKKNKVQRMQNTSLLQQDYQLKNGSTFSAGIDLLKDGLAHQHTLGLGLRYNF